MIACFNNFIVGFNLFCFTTNNLTPDLKNAKILGETSIALLIHPTITDQQIINYAKKVREVIIEATLD